MSAPEWTEILEWVIGCAKMVAVSESRGIALVAYLGQITNIGSGRVQKLLKESSRECRDISVRDWARENGGRLEILRNRMGSIFRPYNEYWKRSRAKSIKGALLGGPGY